MNAMERIFISYKRADGEKVYKLIDKIEKTLGVKCWYDLEGIETAAQFMSKICTAIDNAEVVLFMHSSAHLGINYDNDWTVKELNYAHMTKKRVVLVKLDDAPLKNLFLMEYGTRNNIDSRDFRQWDKLMNDLRGWLNLGTSKNSVYSKAELEDLHKKGEEFYDKKQYAEAVKLFRKAAEQGYANAQTSLGWMYENGYGVTKDYGEAVRWYRKAAEQGEATAQNTLAIMYQYGSGVTKDYGEAVRWYRKAAEQGDDIAQNNLGYMYENGYGVTKDYGEAVRWYRKAAEQGNATAQNNLGNMYANGYGVKDYGEAVRWYRKAAEQGNASAQYNLGWMYQYGYGVEKDLTQARYWYQKAADQGDEDAKKALARL